VGTIRRDEELGSERVAKGESKKALPRALKTVVEHLPPILAEGVPSQFSDGRVPRNVGSQNGAA
jgi:hypothetical protein